ncbi:hypothetical protein [Marinicella litoralis]|uniref:Uncharacterized protein n=1 Tax=Marinicella litoralis TaxID=644220 RepID=A0A4R6XDX8_9GAMM|nr:hypothetical protein [Marinicella litoralis]TDR16369.1 hypothetical protein C8D91_2896 [Marinicella litoralis]
MIQDVMIVESYTSPTQVMEDQELCFEDKLRILEKWNQIYAIRSKTFPDQAEFFKPARQMILELVNQLVKEHMPDDEMMF